MQGYIEIEKHEEVVTEFAAYKLETDQKLAALKFQLAELQRLIHGAKSERYVPDLPPEQLSLFEQQYQELLEQHTQEVAAHQRQKPAAKKKPARLKLPSHLKVVEEVLEPDVDTSNMVRMGEQETRTLAYKAAELYIKLLTRPQYVERAVPASDTSASDTSASDTPASDASASDTPASDTPASDTPASDTPASDTPASDTSASDTSASDTPASDTSASDTSASDTSASDASANGFSKAKLKEEANCLTITEHRRKSIQPTGPIYIAPMPSRFIDKCIADVSLLVSIIVDKYVDHLPLFRTQGRFRRLAGVEIPRSTMSGWIGQSASKMKILYDTLQSIVLASTYIQVDETRMEVLPNKWEGQKEKQGANKAKGPPNRSINKQRGRKKGKNKKRKTHRGFLYGYLAMQDQLLFFDYDKTRTAANPMRHLKQYQGTLQTDCYEVYDQIREAYAGNITHYHCLNHARRNFEKSLKHDKARADYVLGQFQRLYAIEEVARKANWTVEKIYQVRQEQAKPILVDLFDWMDREYEKVLPASVTGKAMAYMLKRKERMMHYLSDGQLHIDNNPIENKIRPIAVGRRNYLFAGSHQGAQWAALFYSFFACCRLHEVDPAEWLEDVMRRLPEHPVNQIDWLLPHLWKKNRQQQNQPT